MFVVVHAGAHPDCRAISPAGASLAVDPFHLLGQAPVQTHLARGVKLRVERVPDKRVREVVGVGVARGAQECGVEPVPLVQIPDRDWELEGPVRNLQ